MTEKKGNKGNNEFRRVVVRKVPTPGPRVWRRTYGYDHVSLVPGQGNLDNKTPCMKDCLKAEYSKFARQCRSKGGVFKCCMFG